MQLPASHDYFSCGIACGIMLAFDTLQKCYLACFEDGLFVTGFGESEVNDY